MSKFFRRPKSKAITPKIVKAPLVTVEEADSLSESSDISDISNISDLDKQLLGHGLRAKVPSKFKIRRTGIGTENSMFEKRQPKKKPSTASGATLSPIIVVTDTGEEKPRGSFKTVRFDSSIDLSEGRDDTDEVSSLLSVADDSTYDDGPGEIVLDLV